MPLDFVKVDYSPTSPQALVKACLEERVKAADSTANGKSYAAFQIAKPGDVKCVVHPQGEKDELPRLYKDYAGKGYSILAVYTERSPCQASKQELEGLAPGGSSFFYSFDSDTESRKMQQETAKFAGGK